MKRPTRLVAPDFSQKTIQTVAHRAALRCSRPGCEKTTAGPNSIRAKSTSIGEAAHIHAARPGEARYRSTMSDRERASATNAIWLCRNCHRMVDRDEGEYPAELLFFWRERHEENIAKELGKPGVLVRLEWMQGLMEEFADLPPYARLIIKDRPLHWEYSLTAEVLEFTLRPFSERLSDFNRGLYSKRVTILAKQDAVHWAKAKLAELSLAGASLSGLVNHEFAKAWEEPGLVGAPHRIVQVCRLYGACAERFLEIAEDAKFVSVPEGFEGVAQSVGVAATYQIDALHQLPSFLRRVLASPRGTHKFSMTLDLPPGWADRFDQELEGAAASWGA